MTKVDERDYGTLEKGDTRHTLRFTRRLAHAPDKVWRALTEADHLAKWFPSTIEGEFTPGSKLLFTFKDFDGPPLEGEMLGCEPPRLLEFMWGEDALRFELAPDGEGTILRFSDTIEEVGKAARDGAGWHACLDMLDEALAGGDPKASSGDRWQDVNAEYKRRLGPE